MKIEFWELVKEFGIPTLPLYYAATPNEAQHFAKLTGYPVAIKINSPDISHKSDVGGVVLNVKNNKELEIVVIEMFNSIRKQFPDAKINGVSIQQMSKPGGIECIVGIKKDPQFGHVIMFGLGGIHAEIFKDISFRVTSFEEFEAYNMISEIKSYALLNGIRGAEPVSIECIIDVIMKLQEISKEHPEIEELDINPLICYSDKAICVDGRVF